MPKVVIRFFRWVQVWKRGCRSRTRQSLPFFDATCAQAIIVHLSRLNIGWELDRVEIPRDLSYQDFSTHEMLRSH